MVVLRLIEGLQHGDGDGVADVDGGDAGVVQVDVDDRLHLTLVQQHNQFPQLVLGSVLRVDLRQVLGPIAVVSMRHLLDHRREHHSVYAQRLQVAQLVPDAGEGTPAIVVQLVAMRRLGHGVEAVDQDLIHGHLRPSPRAPRQVAPRCRGVRGVQPLEPRDLPERPELVGRRKVRLLRVSDLGLVEQLRVASNRGGSAVVVAPLALVDALAEAILLV
mmetsp:Transcript_72117/g.207056  ORF Transcript_72117/g.207056 Transcript_72117/m.207056 type:complete len:217 (+) Transcript_72117:2455-3105(+)